MELFIQFAQDVRSQTLFAFIIADVVLAIAAAIKGGYFSLREVGAFYRTNVAPYLIGYLLVYGMGIIGMSELFGSLFGEIVATVGVAPAVLNLTASIGKNLLFLRDSDVAKAVKFGRDEMQP